MQVHLAKDWTDPTGTDHTAGDTVEVDAVTLAELEATGVVASAAEPQPGPQTPLGEEPPRA